jgi:hypothetical protein
MTAGDNRDLRNGPLRDPADEESQNGTGSGPTADLSLVPGTIEWLREHLRSEGSRLAAHHRRMLDRHFPGPQAESTDLRTAVGAALPEASKASDHEDAREAGYTQARPALFTGLKVQSDTSPNGSRQSRRAKS